MVGRDERSDAALRALFQAIAARDGSLAARLLAASPDLTRQAAAVGATRTSARAWFFDEIAHYAYAGDTALHLAAAAGTADIAGTLVAKGADVHARNRRGAEPLHYAADGHPGTPRWDPAAPDTIVRLLIAAGADPNATDKSGVAPLHRAVRTRSAAAVRALLASGATVRLKNGSGSTPLHLATRNTGRGGSGAPAARAQQAEIIGLLLRHGARASDRDAAGRSVRAGIRADWIRTLLDER